MAEKELKKSDVRELEDALTVAKIACHRFKSKVTYAGNLYDCAEDVIHAIEQMTKETPNLA
ncbi:MAG: hypothetical protein JNM12_00020 [Alphaproteobacteria bacterium]|nr:hypothetical protein [Alphaproteobacteria bacterium]